MTSWRALLAIVGLAVWGVGVWRFASGSYGVGGLLIGAGGLCLILAASGGWRHLFEGVLNWLYFWR